jgi:hypothetical protein
MLVESSTAFTLGNGGVQQYLKMPRRHTDTTSKTDLLLLFVVNIIWNRFVRTAFPVRMKNGVLNVKAFGNKVK